MTNVETAINNWRCIQCGQWIKAGLTHVCGADSYYLCPYSQSTRLTQVPVCAFSDQGEELLKRLDALTQQIAGFAHAFEKLNARVDK